jgi:hypothetical protein
MSKPKINSSGEKELEKVEAQFNEFDKQVKDLTLDRMNMAPKLEVDSQYKFSQKDIEKSDDHYLKPIRSIGSKEKFNENYRDQYNFSKEYVRFIPENKEIIGEIIELWTKPFAGIPAEFWKVPCGKPVWAPRYVAERIKGCTYHRLIMQQGQTASDGMGTYFGNMIADTTIQRLDALPVSTHKSIFMGASS